MGSEIKNRPEWKAVVDAVKAGDDFQDALEFRHMDRATEISIAKDGVVTFVVERHPHLFGKQARGEPSYAYERWWTRYVFHPCEHGRVANRQHLENVIDYPVAAAQLVERFLIESGELEEKRVTCRTRESAERYARSVDWLLELREAPLSDAERQELTECCVEHAVSMITEASE